MLKKREIPPKQGDIYGRHKLACMAIEEELKLEISGFKKKRDSGTGEAKTIAMCFCFYT